MPVSIGELLLCEHRVTPAQLEHARTHQANADESLALGLVRLGHVADDDLTGLLSRELGVPSVDLGRFAIDRSVIALIPPETAQKYRVVPVARRASTLTVALSEPTNVFALDDIQFMTGCRVEPVLASETAMLGALDRYYPTAQRAGAANRRGDGEGPPQGPWTDAASFESVAKALEETAAGAGDGVELLTELEPIDVESLERQSTEAPVIRMVNLMLMSAIQSGASDIHLEPYEKELRVRFRVDGILHHVMLPSLKFRDAITSRIKIMARLDIAEKRLPQDGRMKIRLATGGPGVVDFRVSSLPTLFGEKLVLRLLDTSALRLDMASLGMDPEALRTFQSALARPWGMVLVTGPTGSGKTSTLYSAIARLNTPGTNIMTAEDPIEFNLAGVNQVQVRDNIGLTFAAVLRAFLRQDPNIILVGEIRDGETAEIAVQAALTGHLVLSTLHTNDAPSAVTRLVHLGIAPFLIASSVHAVCAQRLVRRLCPGCAQPDRHGPEALAAAGFTPDDAAQVLPRRGAGCPRCRHTGYLGRVGLYEVMEMTDSLRELVLRGASGRDLRRAAVDNGMATLRQSGLRKVMNGVTTIEEVVRETVA